MKFLALLIIFFINMSSYGEETHHDCEKSLFRNGYKKYSNQYAENFKIFHRGNSFYWWVGNDWFSNKVGDEELVCLSVKKIGELNRIVLMSSTLLEVFNELNVTDKIVGIGEKKFIFDQATLLKNAKDLGTFPSSEMIISLKPDVVFGYHSPVLSTFYEQLKKMRIPVVFIDDFKQKHPLGRAEQRIIIGVLLGKFSQTLENFKKIVNNYKKYRKLVSSTKNVLLGNYSATGSWRRISPKSDFWQVVKDAGGVDVFSSIKYLNISTEIILKNMNKFDHWLPQTNYQSILEVKKESNFLNILLEKSKFKVSTYSKKINQMGGAEFWDVAMMRPDLLLYDLILVLGTSRGLNPQLSRWYQTLR